MGFRGNHHVSFPLHLNTFTEYPDYWKPESMIRYRAIVSRDLIPCYRAIVSRDLILSLPKLNVSYTENLILSYNTIVLNQPFQDSLPKTSTAQKESSKLTPWIVPATLITTGTVLHFMPDTKQSYRTFIRDHFSYSGHLDDYLPYAPLVATYGLQLAGIKGKSNPGNLTAIAVKSFLLNGLITDRLKYLTNVQRPNGDMRSFPSGHTSKAFAMAHIMHREMGESDIWFGVAAYSCAAATAILRTAKDAHWISDVFAGAGIGILSTELIYRTHLYKWDSEHLKRLDIFPFQWGKQTGMSLVYRF